MGNTSHPVWSELALLAFSKYEKYERKKCHEGLSIFMGYMLSRRTAVPRKWDIFVGQFLIKSYNSVTHMVIFHNTFSIVSEILPAFFQI